MTDREAAKVLFTIAAICWTAFWIFGTAVGTNYVPSRKVINAIECVAAVLPIWILLVLVFRVFWRVDRDK